MDHKFNSEAAKQLILSMNKYCEGISKEVNELRDTLNNSGAWDDNQKKAFQENMQALADDLDKAVYLESDYMKTFYQRYMELKG